MTEAEESDLNKFVIDCRSFMVVAVKQIILRFEKEMDLTTTRKRQHFFHILKGFFSSETHQSIKRWTVAERLTEIHTQMQLHVIGCV